ncbi:MAG: ABC transporter substrate-binding protein [Gemmatimonadota bacterium]
MTLRPSTRCALALAVAACGGSETPSGAVAADGFCEAALQAVDEHFAGLQAEAGGGTLVGAGVADLDGGMNPLATTLVASIQHQLHVNLMSLVRLDANLAPVPYLAESWSLSEDGTLLEFRLRDDVAWHDGTPTRAADVAFTFERARDPETGYANPAYFRWYENVEVVDDRTVRFRVQPHAQMLETWAVVPILPAHLLEPVPPAELATHPFNTRCPVGNGPFRFLEHREGDRWIFARNPAFPDAIGGPPQVARYVFRVIPEQTTLLTELLTGAVHVYFDVRPDQAATIAASQAARVLRAGSREFAFIAWNARRAPFGDAALRRALTQAIDRGAIVTELLGGYGSVAETSVPPFHWAFDPSVGGAVAHDPTAAAAALAALGWEDRDGDGVREDASGAELTIELLYNQENQLRATIAQIVQADLAAVGVAARPQGLEMATVLARVTDPERREFDALLLAYETDFRIDDADLFHSGRRGGGLALAGTANPDLDAILDRLPLVPDRDEAVAEWARYQQALVAEQPFTYLYFPDVLTGVSRRLRNVEIDERGAWRTIQQWSLEPGPDAAAGQD